MKTFDVIITGAGAAGTFCAIAAAERGLRVALLERNDDLGAKIRISGGGRCNFTHLDASPAAYLSHNPRFCHSALSRFRPQDAVAWFAAHGVTGEEKARGQLFAVQKSRGVLAALQSALMASGGEFFPRCDITAYDFADGQYRLATTQGDFLAPQWVIATGAPSFPKLGASDFALRVAKHYRVKNYPFKPALVPLLWDAGGANLTGVSVTVEATTTDAPTFRDALLFTHRGVSAPAILQVSSYWQKGNPVTVNFLPDVTLATLLAAKSAQPQRPLGRWLRDFLPNAVVAWLLPQDKPLGAYKNSELAALFARWQAFSFIPTGTEGMNKAEVCTGGVDTRELDPRSLMVKKQRGLHFIGEAVDVTGWLGGYNFQWAWASGWSCAQFLHSGLTA